MQFYHSSIPGKFPRVQLPRKKTQPNSNPVVGLKSEFELRTPGLMPVLMVVVDGVDVDGLDQR